MSVRLTWFFFPLACLTIFCEFYLQYAQGNPVPLATIQALSRQVARDKSSMYFPHIAHAHSATCVHMSSLPTNPCVNVFYLWDWLRLQWATTFADAKESQVNRHISKLRIVGSSVPLCPTQRRAFHPPLRQFCFAPACVYVAFLLRICAGVVSTWTFFSTLEMEVILVCFSVLRSALGSQSTSIRIASQLHIWNWTSKLL